ncbi:MAG: hypothetical protein ACLUD0_12560 [Eubacterium ramulus]
MGAVKRTGRQRSNTVNMHMAVTMVVRMLDLQGLLPKKMFVKLITLIVEPWGHGEKPAYGQKHACTIR